MSAPPFLPPELWISILANAVHVPGLFDTKWNHSPDELMWEGVSASMNMDRESSALRRAIVLVSRDWMAMGRQFLYEELVLDRRAKGVAVTNLLEQTSVLETGGYARWVKRVTIANRLWFMDATFPHLERLLRQCSNLQIIQLSVTVDHFSLLPRVNQLFQFQLAPSLRRISVVELLEKAGPIHLLQGSNPALRLDSAVLPSNWLPRMFPSTKLPPTPASVSNLSVLGIVTRGEVVNLPSWDLPALRYFSIGSLTVGNIPSILPFMAANGHRLLGLTVWMMRLCHSLHEVLEHTTALRSLVLDDLGIVALCPPSSTQYNTITHIGLTGIDYDYIPDAERIQMRLRYILSRNIMPTLRTVRILARHIPFTLKRGWLHPIAIAAQYGIRLEDRQKRLLRYQEPTPR